MSAELDTLRTLLLSFAGSDASYPFNETAQVFKAGGKIFAIVATEAEPLSISLKAEPNDALAYRDIYPAVRPGYHLNKKHWNTVTLDGSVPETVLKEMVEDSYALIVASLPKAVRAALLRT